MSAPEASLTTFLDASVREEKEPGQNLWELDGVEYIVPDDVRRTAERFMEMEERDPLDQATGILLPDQPDKLARRLLQNSPNELLVSMPEGVAMGGVSQNTAGEIKRAPMRFGLAPGPRVLEDLKNAYQLTQDEYSHLSGLFPQDYDPELVGPGVYVEEAADMETWSEFVAAAGHTSSRNTRNNAGGMILRRITQIEISSSQTREDAPVGIAHHSIPPEITIYAGKEDSSPLDEIAETLQTFLENSLEQLKTDHPESWEEHYGYTDVEIVDDRE